MCNRYIARWIDLRLFGLGDGIAVPKFEEFSEKARFTPASGASSSANLPPSTPDTRPLDRSPVIRFISGETRIDLLQWGMVPPFSLEPATTYATFNAKAETVATKPAFRHAWEARQRCLIPVDAFYEWKGEKPHKEKYRIGLNGRGQFCLAGLWERWQRGDQVLQTFTIITTEANALVAEIHAKKRMPVIIAPKEYDRWLRDTADVSDLLKPYPSELMEATLVPGRPSKTCDFGPSLFE